MNTLRRWWGETPPGTRVLLTVWLLSFPTVLILNALGLRLFPALALDSQAVRRLELWRLVTYALVPGHPAEWLINGLFLWSMGSAVERVWPPRALLKVYFLGAILGGIILVWLVPGAIVLSSVGALMALLVVWHRIHRGQEVQLWMGPTVSATAAAWFTAAMLLLPGVFCSGKVVVALALGALGGWAFLGWQGIRSSRRAVLVETQSRGGRLEL